LPVRRGEIAVRWSRERWMGMIGWLLLMANAWPAQGESVLPADEAGGGGDWHYGTYLDLNYTINFNFPENHRWRGRTTTPRTNELSPNMGLAYVRKAPGVDSPWGMELLAQGGYDTTAYAFGNDRPLLAGADTLRHFGRANVTYQAPIGRGLAIQIGLFNSLIGYESLYAKDNLNYTRSWIADNSPYQMLGVNARYRARDNLSVALFVVNGYWHLANPNSLPSYGAQAVWQPADRLTMTQTFYYGPDQRNTAIDFWRVFSDSIIEWKSEAILAAVEYQVGTENMAVAGQPRAFWMGAALPLRWTICTPWSLAVRPEFFWDRNGRQTGFEQTITALTTTLEYRVPYKRTNTVLRLEHRFDESTGSAGGFFRRGEVSPGIGGLTGSQHLFLLAVLWSFDS
jgi:hypothetical protein